MKKPSAAEEPCAAYGTETEVERTHCQAQLVGAESGRDAVREIVIILAAALELCQKPAVILVAGVDLYRTPCRLHRGDAVAHIHICTRVEIVPFAVSFRDRNTGQRVESLAVHPVSYIAFGRHVFAAFALPRASPGAAVEIGVPLTVSVALTGIAVSAVAGI